MTKLNDELARSGKRRLARISATTGISLDRLRDIGAGAEASAGEARKVAAAVGTGLEELIAAPSDTEARAQVLFRRSWTGREDEANSTDNFAKRAATAAELLPFGLKSRRAEWRGQFLPPKQTLENAEENAARFRGMFAEDDQLSPLIALPEIVSERMGVMLFTVRNADIDGASAYFNGVPFAFVSERFPPRMLFTLAHETGHLIAHHDPDVDSALIDEDVEAPAFQHDAVTENYANTFASALLMPRAAVGVALQTVRRVARAADQVVGDIEIGYLARIFGVSFWAAARRCEDLQLIPRGGAFALNERLVSEFGSAEQRAESLGLPPRAEVRFPPVPPALIRGAVAGIHAGEVSIGKAASMLGLSVADLFVANEPTRH
jgi:Zn-dependent peptidase ImmA (M78 family)